MKRKQHDTKLLRQRAEEIAEGEGLRKQNPQLFRQYKNSLQLLEKTFASLREAVFIIDAKTTRILNCNPAASQIFGYRKEEMLGQTTNFLHVDEEKLEEFRKSLFPAIEERGCLDLPEFQMKRRNGEVFFTNHSVMPLEDDQGKRIGWVSVVRDITERKRTEEALQRSQQLFSSIFRVNPAATILSWWADGRCVDANEAYAKLVGYTREELIGKTTVELDIWTSTEERQRVVTELAQKGHLENVELTLRKKNGELINTVAGGEMFIMDGQRYILSFFFDITERKRMEEELRRSRDELEIKIQERTAELTRANKDLQERLRFEQMLSDLSARFLNIKSDEIDREIKRALREIVDFFGVSTCLLIKGSADETQAVISYAAEADGEPPVRLGINVVPLFPWTSKSVPHGKIVTISSMDDLPEEASIDKQSYLAWGIRSALTIPIPFEGSVRHSISLSCRKEERGWPEEYNSRLRLLGDILVNSLELTQKNEMLRESEARLSLAASAAEIGMWTLDFRTGDTWGTDKQRELFGFHGDEEVGLEMVLPRIHPDDREQFQQTLTQADSKGYQRSEFRIVLPDGSIRWILSCGRPHFSASGEPEFLMGVCLDITERKQGEMERDRLILQLKESEGRLRYLSSELLGAQERERKALAAELHDSFASELATIKWSLERILLAGKKRGERDIQEEVWLEDIITKVQNIIADVRGIMTNLRPSTLDDLGILATISWFTREFEKTYGHIRVESRIGITEEEVPDMLKTVIFRVLQEATNNIARHSRGDLVSIALRKKEDKLQFSVRDNGHGFDVQEKLSAKHESGSLGLDSMRERVEISGGKFTIESTPGKGTIIQAEWPAITPA